MRIIQLTAISAAVLASTAALAAEPVYMVDGNAVQPTNSSNYAYEDRGVIRNTTGAVVGGIRNTTGALVGGTKTIFGTLLNPASISAEVGSMGYGANLGYSINDKVELQAGWAGGDVADLFGGDFDANDVNYDVDADFSNPYMGVQLRPAANWFTMGAGIIVPDNDIEVTSNPNGGIYKVNGNQYNANDVGTLKGTLEHRNELAPYATIGFRPNITNNFGVFGEIGAAYLGKTDADINSVSNNLVVRDETGAVTGETSSSVAAIAERELEDKNYAEWLPIVKLGATYRF
ncbi:hypothetical protein [Psychrobacter sp. M13]|uniref:hypothetical protein n=1 Tax=Psychrobacter sp. M13 TaxID=3067275 RepID=UPI00273C0A89|nr:hypothetical protein [Psychrobacter sp. M13]WLP95548.1 hypothetical protein Q9G97_05470 [Psychrobacter sp. M13]